MSYQNVSYNSANFIGNGAMEFVVESGDVRTFGYNIVDDIMTVFIQIVEARVSGIANTQCRIKIPAGKTALKSVNNNCKTWTDDEENAIPGTLAVEAGSTWIDCYNRGFINGGLPWDTDPDCPVWIMGQISFPIQT